MPEAKKGAKKPVENKEAEDKKDVKKPSNLLRVNNAMIHDIKGNDGRKAVSVGLTDKDGNTRIGTIYAGTVAINPDPKTASLPAHQQKSYVAISRDKTYDFVMSKKDPTSKTGYKKVIDKIPGADIVDQNHAYMKDKRAEYAKAAEVEAQNKALASAMGVQNESYEAG